MNRTLNLLGLIACFALSTAYAASPDQTHPTWYFATSGDSRNCGDVVMPAIAADAIQHEVAFYWQLGDLRKISDVDEDFVAERTLSGKATNLADYERHAWDDFVQNQVKPWGDLPYYLGIGNHEVHPPKNRELFIKKFQSFLDRPDLRAQRLRDDPNAKEPRTYYHWIRDGVDFVYLDNATADQFDAAQMKWVEGVLERAEKNDSIRTIVVGMHKALPESISRGHSMNESSTGTESGLRVYEMLLKAQNDSHKLVYVIASHSHYFMDGTFNTPYWKEHGGVLPGWIVGTAGAQRYPLPAEARDAKEAKTNVYGYLIAAVNPPGEAPGTIKFKFEKLQEDRIPPDVAKRFGTAVHECFVGNRKTGGPMD